MPNYGMHNVYVKGVLGPRAVTLDKKSEPPRTRTSHYYTKEAIGVSVLEGVPFVVEQPCKSCFFGPGIEYMAIAAEDLRVAGSGLEALQDGGSVCQRS